MIPFVHKNVLLFNCNCKEIRHVCISIWDAFLPSCAYNMFNILSYARGQSSALLILGFYWLNRNFWGSTAEEFQVICIPLYKKNQNIPSGLRWPVGIPSTGLGKRGGNCTSVDWSFLNPILPSEKSRIPSNIPKCKSVFIFNVYLLQSIINGWNNS